MALTVSNGHASGLSSFQVVSLIFLNVSAMTDVPPWAVVTSVDMHGLLADDSATSTTALERCVSFIPCVVVDLAAHDSYRSVTTYSMVMPAPTASVVCVPVTYST